MSEAYFQYWGKSTDRGHHLLVYHGLDACSVAQSWIEHNLPFVNDLAKRSAVSFQTLKGLLCLFSSLHDAGKFSVTFQNLRPDLLMKLQGRESGKYYDPCKARHDSLGWMLWERRLQERVIEHLKSYGRMSERGEIHVKNLLDVFARIAFGHHGRPPIERSNGFDVLFNRPDIESALRYTDDLLRNLLPLDSKAEIARWVHKTKAERKSALHHLRRNSWRLAGMIVLSDWVASGDTFPFVEENVPLDDYFQVSQETARGVFSKIGLYSAGPSSQAGFDYLFPGYSKSPTPLQSFCDKVELTEGPQLWVLEDVTGSGKTEAACTLVSRMLKEGLAEGVFVALPTMATSNAMYERMAGVYHRFFAENSRPSLVLSHGSRYLSDTFRESYSELSTSVAAAAGRDTTDDSLPNCSAWLADSNKKALLADVGVGTLDQVLLGALRVRYQSLRVLGMSSKVLVVDEVHAYDPYMLRILENVLAHHARMGLPVVLLSATLPRAILNKLCRAFHGGLEDLSSVPELPSEYRFPLVTKVDWTGIRQYDIEPRRESIRTLPVAFLDNLEEVYGKISAARENGQCACWIRNTIQDITEVVQELKQVLGEDAVDVFHSRFALADRLEIEKHVCKTFGKESGSSDREGKVLIASQVVEQSLDLDFDVVITDLAPIDLMIQRAGRQHRHRRDRHGNPLTNASETCRESPVLYVYAPPETAAPSETWFRDCLPGASYVYPNTAQLWRTREILSQEAQIELPARARALVEAVYGAEPLETPEVFLEAEDKAWGIDAAARDQADFNTIAFENGYSDSGGNWDSEERIRTRLGDVQRMVYLARFENGQLSPYCTGEYGWDLSAIKVRAASMQGEIDYPEDLRKAIEVMRDQRWIENNALFLIVQGEELTWQCRGNRESDTFEIRYDSVLGLSRNKP